MGTLENNANTKYNRTLTKWQRLWRANSGQGWRGRILDKKNGILKLINFSPFHGMPAGTPDNIGFDSIIITPEMVGHRVAVFVGTEIKATKGDKLGPKQRDWRDKIIVPMGGIHREVREDGSVIESGFKKSG
jgi:hypothetical protein